MTGIKIPGLLNIMHLSKRTKLRLLSGLLLWGVLCILLTFGFTNARAVEGVYRAASLRYNTPISGKSALDARRYSIEQGDESAFWPTFWRGYTASFSSELFKADAACIAYSGNAFLVWPAKYLSGTAPGIADNIGCTVSTALAWKLWGSNDVVGKIVEVDGEERIVRGVFEDERELALLSYMDEDTTQSWSVIELEGGSPYATRDDARSYAVASKLGNPDSIVMGAGLVFFANVLAALPLLILVVYSIVMIFNFLRKRYSLMSKFLLFFVFAGFSVLLPVILDAVPSWLIPTRWSDFSFWSSLVQQAGNSVKDFLELVPQARDVEGKILLLQQAVIAFAASFCALAACIRWYFIFYQHESAAE